MGVGGCVALARRVEAERVVVGVLQGLAPHQRRYAHRQVGRAAARDVVDLHVGGHGVRAHQRLLVGGRHAAFEHGQAEFLDAEHARAKTGAAGRAQLHLVHAELGRGRDLELALGAAPARGGGAPRKRLLVLLATAHVGDDQGVGAACGQRETLAVLAAQHMLHRHGLARAQQRAVEDGMGDFVGARLAARGHVEAPGLDAALPVAPGEGHVLRPFRGGARAHEVGLAALVAAAARRLGREALEAGDALRVGWGLRELFATAIGHAHDRALHGLALVERCHPGRRVLAAELEMHAQIGDQGRSAHNHRAARAMALVEQRSAQARRGDLHHVEAHGQRNAHDLERARVAALVR